MIFSKMERRADGNKDCVTGGAVLNELSLSIQYPHHLQYFGNPAKPFKRQGLFFHIAVILIIKMTVKMTMKKL